MKDGLPTAPLIRHWRDHIDVRDTNLIKYALGGHRVAGLGRKPKNWISGSALLCVCLRCNAKSGFAFALRLSHVP